MLPLGSKSIRIQRRCCRVALVVFFPQHSSQRVSSAIVVVPIIVVVVSASTVVRSGHSLVGAFGTALRELTVCFAIALLAINIGYFFEETCVPLREYEFISESLSGIARSENMKGNRFLRTWASHLPVPVPRNYVLGIDLAKFEFERGYWSYLNGEFQNKGWWYFYISALAVKEPLGFWGLAALATVAIVVRIFTRNFRLEEWLLVCTSVVILVTVSSQTGYTHHLWCFFTSRLRNSIVASKVRVF